MKNGANMAVSRCFKGPAPGNNPADTPRRARHTSHHVAPLNNPRAGWVPCGHTQVRAADGRARGPRTPGPGRRVRTAAAHRTDREPDRPTTCTAGPRTRSRRIPPRCRDPPRAGSGASPRAPVPAPSLRASCVHGRPLPLRGRIPMAEPVRTRWPSPYAPGGRGRPHPVADSVRARIMSGPVYFSALPS
ncbi:hypothetical protein GCM10018787_51440 [Streptomyces thermodiastaticus]|nr:hypothetical protein GCM10018787_51440 [Streptomyces thermodiastaticus]